ncbi:MAG: hypothetical protein ACFCBW_16555 [Candidatus Competibacterales bacterium]
MSVSLAARLPRVLPRPLERSSQPFQPSLRPRVLAPGAPCDALVEAFDLPFPKGEPLTAVALQRLEPPLGIVGGGAVLPVVPSAVAPEDGRFAWRLLPTQRDTTAESLLVGALLEAARQRGVTQLCSQEKIPLAADGTDPWLLGQHGLTRVDSSAVLEVAFADVHRRIARLHQALMARGGLPVDAEVQGLDDPVAAPVRAQLEAEGMMDGFEFDARLTSDHPQAIQRHYSTVVTIAGQLAGFMLVAPLEGRRGYSVLARWVSPTYQRRNWINVVLVHRSVSYGVPLGLEMVRFNANPERHPETFALARRLGGQVVETRCRFGRRL